MPESPPIRLDVRTRADGRSCVARLTGELDVECAARVRSALSELVRDNARVFVDLQDMTFMDSTGLRALHEANLEASAAGCRVTFVSAHPNVLRVLELTGMDDFELTSDRSDLAG